MKIEKVIRRMAFFYSLRNANVSSNNSVGT